MKTLHEILDAIFIAEQIGEGGAVLNLTSAEFNELCHAIEGGTVTSRLGGESITFTAESDCTPWLVPKYCDGDRVGYVLGITVKGEMTARGGDDKPVTINISAEASVCSHREPYKPRLFKTIQAAINSAPTSHENITLWTH